MTFYSILFESAQDRPTKEPLEAPACFADLNLDQVIDTITTGKQEYTLTPFFLRRQSFFAELFFQNCEALPEAPFFQSI